MGRERSFRLALFYCKNTPGSTEEERQQLEKEYGGSLRLFPLPCGGRMEPLHLMKSLEEFADGAYLITCPEGSCRYFEGNARAAKRVDRTGEVLASIGLEKERVGTVANSKENPMTLSFLAARIMEKVAPLGTSPVRGAASEPKRVKGRRLGGGSKSRLVDRSAEIRGRERIRA